MNKLTKILLSFLGILLCLSSYSQNYSNSLLKITGTVQDVSETPLPYTSVAVYNTIDSNLVTGVATSDSGTFVIPIVKGSYYLQISFLSYQTKTVSNVKVANTNVNLGVIKLQSSQIVLQEIAIKGTKSQVELKLDKRVYNVGQDITNAGGNASEVLENVPSVSVDVEGNVSLRGNENVRILINGKPSGMIGVSTSDALRQLQANLIEKVEVISNPSARYDSEGEVGIINIVLKKEKRNGLNGSYELTAGYPDRYSGSFSLNYKKNKTTFFTNYGLTYHKSPGSGSSFQQFKGDSVFAYNRTREHIRGALSHNARVGIDYTFNKYNSLTVATLFKNKDEDNSATLVYNDLDASNLVAQSTKRSDEQDEVDNTVEAELNYIKTYEQKGKEWSTAIKAFKNKELGNSNILQEFSNGNLPITQLFNNYETENNFLFQTDYIKPIKKDGKFETGLKATLRTIENDYSVSEQNALGSFSVLPEFDNQFEYQENIYAGYAMFGNKVKKFSYQLGIRAEFTDVEVKLLNTNKKNSFDYINLFPSSHFSYKLDTTNTLQLSYSRRINRPRVRNLLPLFTYSDNRNLYTGNPNLQPEFANSFEIGHLKYFNKGTLLSSIYYRNTTDAVQRITISDSLGITQRLPINLAVQNSFGLELSANLQLKKYWRARANFNFFRTIIDGDYLDQNLDADLYSWMVNASSKITIKKKLDFQTTIVYIAPRETTQGNAKSISMLNLGLSKDVLNKKGTLTFSVKDIFNTRKWRSVTDTDNFYAESEFQWRARQFLLTFNYRVNQKKQRGGSRRSEYSGGGDEY